MGKRCGKCAYLDTWNKGTVNRFGCGHADVLVFGHDSLADFQFARVIGDTDETPAWCPVERKD